MTHEHTEPISFDLHGVRGSTPVSGEPFLRHGGNTSCFSVTLPDGSYLLIDCGSGLSRLEALLSEGASAEPFVATILLTHFHWDHIEGLPTFSPLHDPRSRLRILAAPPPGMTVAETLSAVVRPPWFPVALDDVPASVTFEALPGEPFAVGPLTVRCAPLRHPGGVTGYRIDHGERSVVLATDIEAGEAGHDATMRELAQGASVLIHDAQFTPEEYDLRQGWGHSTWQQAADAARDAGVEQLLLTSHAPWRSDEEIDAIVEQARTRFAAVEAAWQGCRIPLS